MKGSFWQSKSRVEWYTGIVMKNAKEILKKLRSEKIIKNKCNKQKMKMRGEKGGMGHIKREGKEICSK